MRPSPGITLALILVVIVGVLTSMSLFHKDEGVGGQYHQQGIFVLVVTGILVMFLAILATSKFWFPHLWKKNSTHSRHKQHTRFHPAMREKEYKKRR
jgi:hypothetical protein